MSSNAERTQNQEKIEKQRSQKWRQELGRIQNKAFDVSFVHNEETIKRERWQILRETSYGSGDFWTLVKAVFPDDARDYAIKIVIFKDLTGIKGLNESYYKKERLKILQSLQHPKLVGIRQSYITNDGKAYIFMDLIGHNVFLSSYLKTIPNENIEIRAKMWCKHIADALSYLHSMGIGFGHNLNIDNILIDKKEGIKLFGLDLFHCCYKTNGVKVLCNLTETQWSQYSGPEIFQEKHDELNSDIFRFGVIVYYLMTYSFPFEKPDDKNKFVQQLTTKSWDNEKIKDQLCKDLLSKIFVEDIAMRASIDELLKCEWFKI